MAAMCRTCKKPAKPLELVKEAFPGKVVSQTLCRYSVNPIAMFKNVVKMFYEARKWGTHTHTNTRNEYCNYPACVCAPSVKNIGGFKFGSPVRYRHKYNIIYGINSIRKY